jgi:alkylation response protein AidB-like acyl-CoA dehydrogenase
MSNPHEAVSAASLLDTVRGLEPIIREHAPVAERERRLPAAVAHAMRDQGLFRMWRPKAFGGYETDPMTAFEVFEEVSRIDSAAGWTLQLSCGADAFGGWFPDQGAREIFGAADAILAGALFPPRQAVPVEGGYRVTGRTPFVSGVDHCSWVFGQAHIHENGAPRLGESGDPVTLITACPIGSATVVENWHTLGMRGTGSHDVMMCDVFVPEGHTALLVPLDSPGSAYRGPLYRFTAWAAVAALSTVATGIARAAIDDLIELAATKSPSYTAKPLKDRGIVQAQIGRAEGALGAARAFLYQSLRETWNEAEKGRTIDMPHKTRLQLAATQAVTAAAEAVDLVQAAAGTTGIREERRFERHFRDVHTISQHGFISASRFESVGQLLLGVPVEWPFYPL